MPAGGSSSQGYSRFFCLGWLTLVGLVLFGWRLGKPGLMDPDEGRYAEIAREMLELGDWLIPHLNHLPYLEKPPLMYWLVALFFSICGQTEWCARLPSALAAWGGLYLTYGLGRALGGERLGFWGAMVLATSGGYLVLGRLLTLDMAFAFSVNVSLGLGYLALSRGREQLWPISFVALALAVLIKGPAALVLAGLVGSAAAWFWGRQTFKALSRPRFWLILAVLLLPWFLYVTWRYPEFPRFFLWEHHVERYLDGVRFHAEPWWYFGPVLVAFMLPWTGLLPWAIGRQNGLPYRDRGFLLLWSGLVLLFFSFSRGKLAPYILPALLPLSLILGSGLAEVSAKDRRFWDEPGLRLSLILWGMVFWVLLALYLFPPAKLEALIGLAAPFKPYAPWILLLLALTPTLTWIFRRGELLLVGALGVAALLPLALEGLGPWRSPREVGLSLKDHWRPGDVLVGVFLYSQGVSFYSGQVFHLLDFRTELDFGKQLAPNAGLILKTREDLKNFVARHPRVFFYLKYPEFVWLKTQIPGEYEILARHRDCLLVAGRRKYF